MFSEASRCVHKSWDTLNIDYLLLKADDHHEEKMFHYIADSFHASATCMTINEPISATKTSLRYSQVFIPALPGKLSGKFLR